MSSLKITGVGTYVCGTARSVPVSKVGHAVPLFRHKRRVAALVLLATPSLLNNVTVNRILCISTHIATFVSGKFTKSIANRAAFSFKYAPNGLSVSIQTPLGELTALSRPFDV